MESKAGITPIGLSDQDERIGVTVREERDRLLRFIKRYLPDDEEAEDILQDVFYQLVEAYRMMKPVERVSSWLFTVARNKLTDRFRKKKSIPFSHSPGNPEEELPELARYRTDPSKGPDAVLISNMFMEELGEALHELPAEQREAFVLHELEGYSFREIAEMSGENLNTLISRKRYAVLFLRERLRDIYDDLIDKN